MKKAEKKGKVAEAVETKKAETKVVETKKAEKAEKGGNGNGSKIRAIAPSGQPHNIPFMIEMIKSKKSDKAILEAFTARYNAAGVKDEKFIGKRIRIYKKIAQDAIAAA